MSRVIASQSSEPNTGSCARLLRSTVDVHVPRSCWKLSSLLLQQHAVADDIASGPETIAELQMQLLAAQEDVEDIASTAAMVLSEGAYVSVFEALALQGGHSHFRKIPFQPAAMREGKWLVPVKSNDPSTSGVKEQLQLMDAATALKILYKQTDPRVWEDRRFSMLVTSPQPWHDTFHIPGQVNLEQERLGAFRRLWPISNQLCLSRRSQLMDLQVSMSYILCQTLTCLLSLGLEL